MEKQIDPTDSPKFRKAHRRFFRAWETTDKLAEIVLKGHLLVEESIVEALRASTEQPKFIDALRLSFHQRLNVLRAFARRGDAHFWELAIALNTLRNTLAHRLDHSERSDKLKRTREVFLAWRPTLAKTVSEDTALVLLSAAACHSYFSGFTHGTANSKRQTRLPKSNGRAALIPKRRVASNK